MLHKKHLRSIVLLFCCVFVFSGCTSSQKSAEKNPFSITVAPVQVNQQERRILIQTDISNTTESEFHNVSYTLSLNEEAKPHIASQQITYAPVIPEDHLNVVSQETATSASDLPDNTVCGFSSEWDTLLTTEEDLENYENKQPDDLYQDVQTLTVDICWDGGTQSETLPIVWKESD